MYNPYSPTLPVINKIPNTSTYTSPPLPPTTESIAQTVEHGIEHAPFDLSAGTFASKKSRIMKWMESNKEKTASTAVYELCKELESVLGFTPSPSMVVTSRRDLGIKADKSAIALASRSEESKKIDQWVSENKELLASVKICQLSDIVFKATGIYRHSEHLAVTCRSLGVISKRKRGGNLDSDFHQQKEKLRKWLDSMPAHKVQEMTAAQCAAMFLQETGITLLHSTVSNIKSSMGLAAKVGRLGRPSKSSAVDGQINTAPPPPAPAGKPQNNSHIELLQQVRQMFRIVARSEVDLRVKLGEPVEEDLAALAK